MTTVRKALGWLLVLVVALSVSVVARDATVTVSVNDDAPYANNRMIDIQLSYTGNQIPSEMRVFPTTNGDWSEWFEYRDGLKWLLSDDDGLRTIKVETRYWVESATDATVYAGWRVVAGEDDVFLDRTPPVLTATLPDATAYGWYSAPVLVDFSASDAGSGLAEFPKDVTLDGEGVGQSVFGRAVDKAGNEAELRVGGINIDLTPPVLTVIFPQANENGWYDSPVTIEFQMADLGSGLAASPDDVTLDGEGAGQSVVGRAVDKAGNATEVTVDGINIDLTPPVLTVALPEANANGWYNEPVSVDFQVVDLVSGLAVSPDDVTLSDEGAGQSVIGRAVDKAGNATEVTVDGINIDLTPPALMAKVPDVNENGWYNGPVTIDFQAADLGSGLAASPNDVTLADEGVGQSVIGRAVDKAGNEVELRVGGINIDLTPPVLTVALPEANANGWYNQPVTADFAAFDALSGLAVASRDRTFSLSSVATLFPEATDRAGNTVTLPDVVLRVDVDAPFVVLEGIDPGASEDVWVPGPVEVTFRITDAFSGIDTVEYVEGDPVLSGDGGNQVVLVQATDRGGNLTEGRVGFINIDTVLPTTTILLADSEGNAEANTEGSMLAPIDLTAKLDAFGAYDPADVGLGYAFTDGGGSPIEGLNVYATILETDDAGAVTDIQFFEFCEYAPTGGFYYFVLPSEMIPGEVYEVWFEASGQAQLFRARVIAP